MNAADAVWLLISSAVAVVARLAFRAALARGRGGRRG